MKFRIEGADKLTGESRRFVVSAKDQSDAEKQARAKGLLISNIALSHETSVAAVPTTLQYTIKVSRNGKQRVSFKCLACNSDLLSPLEEAGQEFPCPQCGRAFVTPGAEQLKRALAYAQMSQQTLQESARKQKQALDRQIEEARLQEEAASKQREALEGEIEAALNVPDNLVSAPNDKSTKACPACGETILAVARKCKHCGEILDPALALEHRALTEPLERPMPARRTPAKGEIICPNPNCGYVGPPKKVERGSAALGCLLCLLMLLPGILYLIFMGGYRYLCPKCGMEVTGPGDAKGGGGPVTVILVIIVALIIIAVLSSL